MLFLNFVLPLAFGIGLLLGPTLYIAITPFLVFAGIQQSVAIPLGGGAAAILVFGISIATVRRKVQVFEMASRASKVGHFMMAVGNIAAVFTIVLPPLFGYLSGHVEYGHYMWFALPVLLVNLVLWPLGWKLTKL